MAHHSRLFFYLALGLFCKRLASYALLSSSPRKNQGPRLLICCPIRAELKCLELVLRRFLLLIFLESKEYSIF